MYGFDMGLSSADPYNEGWWDGYDVGWVEGYDAGYEDGWDDATR